MAIYVDPIFDWPGPRGFKRWCHMGTDDHSPEGIEALHRLAAKIGMKRAWFQDKPDRPHYDLVPSRRAAAVRLGALEIGQRDFVRVCCGRKLWGLWQKLEAD